MVGLCHSMICVFISVTPRAVLLHDLLVLAVGNQIGKEIIIPVRACAYRIGKVLLVYSIMLQPLLAVVGELLVCAKKMKSPRKE